LLKRVDLIHADLLLLRAFFALRSHSHTLLERVHPVLHHDVLKLDARLLLDVLRSAVKLLVFVEGFPFQLELTLGLLQLLLFVRDARDFLRRWLFLFDGTLSFCRGGFGSLGGLGLLFGLLLFRQLTHVHLGVLHFYAGQLALVVEHCLVRVVQF